MSHNKGKGPNDNRSDMNQLTTGLVTCDPVANAGLPGTGTPLLSETPELVELRYNLAQQIKRLERRLEPIDECLKRRTGERQVGAFLVNVSSSDRQSVDVVAVKELLGDATPMKKVPSVRLTVVPA